jgi:hypothetical protein
MTEEEMTEEEIAEAEERGRRMLVEAAALAALIEAGATQPTRVLPVMMQNLKAVHVGDGEVRIFAVDPAGRVRTGPRGPMTADDLARELSQEESFREIAWTRRHTHTSGTRTGRSLITWQ